MVFGAAAFWLKSDSSLSRKCIFISMGFQLVFTFAPTFLWALYENIFSDEKEGNSLRVLNIFLGLLDFVHIYFFEKSRQYKNAISGGVYKRK